MDTITKEKRSANMAAIKGKNTKPEMKIRKLLFNAGFRYRLNNNGIPGKPDIFLLKYKIAIFINGCFWHRHINCKYAYIPKSNTEFWNNKFQKNIERDMKILNELNRIGIRHMIIWECTINGIKNDDDKKFFIDVFKETLDNSQLYNEL